MLREELFGSRSWYQIRASEGYLQGQDPRYKRRSGNTERLQNLSRPCGFLTTRVQLVQRGFGCSPSPLHAHPVTHTHLPAHPTHCLGYQVTPHNLSIHTPVRKVTRLTRTDPGGGCPFAAPHDVTLLPSGISGGEAVWVETAFIGLT